MPTHTLAQLVIDLVPQWYRVPGEAVGAARTQTLTVGDDAYAFRSARALTPDLREFLRRAEARATEFAPWLAEHPLPAALAVVEEALALEWLAIRCDWVNWPLVVQYGRALSGRTYENAGVACTLVIGREDGNLDVTDPAFQKLLDPVAASPQTYLRVDAALRLVGYESVAYEAVVSAAAYKLYPEFLHPVACALGPGEVAVHHTGRGDLIVLARSEGHDGRGGERELVATCRKGRWRLYDPRTLKNCIGDVLGSYWIGSNLFEVVLDLSFRRHGALLIYDPDRTVLAEVVNPSSIIAPGTAVVDPVRAAFARALHGCVRPGREHGLVDRKRMLLELATMDGALLFDQDAVLAVGAMVPTHPDVGSHAGARTTAARSAQLYGGRPVKVSADGDVDVLFRRTVGEVSHPLSLSFL